MKQTITEKILSKAVGRPVTEGELIFPIPELVTVHDWYVANVDKALQEFGVNQLASPEKVLFTTDHEPVAVSPIAAERQKKVREIAARYQVGHFFDVGRGGHGHIFPVEMGMIRPGMFVEGYDTHVTNYGAVGCLAFAVLTEVTELVALGSIWQTVPETVRIDVKGQLPRGTTIRDAAQKLLRNLDPELVDDTVVEFGGDAMSHLSVDARYTLCNAPTEIGARSSIVEPDQRVLDYLKPRTDQPIELVKSDDQANYKHRITFDLSDCEPQVAAPPRPDNVVDISSVVGIPIDHAYIGSCASGLFEDLEAAASILKDRTLHPRVRMFVTPGTQEIAQRALEQGLTEIFVKAGAVMTQPGCGVCAGGRVGPVAPGETSIGTGTRNDPGRLGPMDADLYLASPSIVAASATMGAITDPRQLENYS